MFSQEFFIQRSFEVVWAVFRVAEHTTRSKIKQALEDKAVDYLMNKDFPTLDGLDEIVRFGAQIGEINKVNSSVLLRELSNLRSAISELKECQKRMLAPTKNPETAPNLEESFSRPPMRISEIIKTISDSINKSQQSQSSAIDTIDNGKSGSTSSELRGESKEVRQESGKENQTVIRQNNAASFAEKESITVFEKKEVFYTPETNKSGSPASKQEQKEAVRQDYFQTKNQEENSPARPPESPARQSINNNSTQESGKGSGSTNSGRFEAAIGFKERNDILMKLMAKRTLCHIKDALLSMPNVSERTIRYDVQRLVDKGVIERVGTGGPNSFFRLKK